VRRSRLPLADLASCSRTAPGPERGGAGRGGTVVRVCVPRLLRISVADGLNSTREAQERQPRIVGRTRLGDLDGRPVQAAIPGPLSLVGGLRLRHRAGGTVRAKVDVITWAGADVSRARQATLTVSLPRDARLDVTGSGLSVAAGGERIAGASFRSVPVIEDE